jgi:hypothetical protein
VRWQLSIIVFMPVCGVSVCLCMCVCVCVCVVCARVHVCVCVSVRAHVLSLYTRGCVHACLRMRRWVGGCVHACALYVYVWVPLRMCGSDMSIWGCLQDPADAHQKALQEFSAALEALWEAQDKMALHDNGT